MAVAHKAIPSNACVVTDNPTLTVMFERDILATSNCATPIDPAALWMYFHASPGDPPSGLVDTWKQVFQQADFVMLLSPYDTVVPWDYPQKNPLIEWFDSRFKLISDQGGIFIYKHAGSSLTTDGTSPVH